MPPLRKVVRGSLLLAALLVAGAGSGLWLLARRDTGNAVLKVTGTIEGPQVDLGPKTTARVREIRVGEGDRVTRGAVVVVLESEEVVADVATLEAAVELAGARLRDLLAGARREEIAAARSEAARAEAQLADLAAGARPEEIRAARQAVAQAEARVRDLEAGARSQEIAEVRSDLAAAEATREAAEREHRRFQTLYDQGLVAAADRDRAWQAHEVAKGRADALRERLALVLAGPRPEQVEGARAEARQARERLGLLEAGPRPHQVEAAQAEVRAAFDRLALLEAGPRPHQVAAARAEVAQAEGALAQARARLADTRLAAPIDGVVLRKNVEPGATVTPGTPVLTLIDPSDLWLRAYVAEVDLGRVRIGQRARLTVDAFPGEPFEAQITEIASEAEFTPRNVQTEKERVNLMFRVKLTVRNPDQRLKPGMPADAFLATD
jgi:multidrug resistance efflux pump